MKNIIIAAIVGIVMAMGGCKDNSQGKQDVIQPASSQPDDSIVIHLSTRRISDIYLPPNKRWIGNVLAFEDKNIDLRIPGGLSYKVYVGLIILTHSQGIVDSVSMVFPEESVNDAYARAKKMLNHWKMPSDKLDPWYKDAIAGRIFKNMDSLLIMVGEEPGLSLEIHPSAVDNQVQVFFGINWTPESLKGNH